jgi:Ca-activated chloride channel family protein
MLSVKAQAYITLKGCIMGARPVLAILTVLAAALGFVSFTDAREGVPAPAGHLVAPQVWTSSRAPGGDRPVAVTGVKVRVDILDGVASTTLLVGLRNPTPRPQEVSLLLSVPEGAAVRHFDFEGKASEPVAEILPAGSAKRTYSAIVARLRDPGLLEFVGTSLLRTSVFPVPASGTQKVQVKYEHVLPFAGGRYEYVLPRTQRLQDSNLPFDIEVRIRSARPISAVYSPSHPVQATRRGPGEILVHLDAVGAREPGSFLLCILPETGPLSATLFAYPEPGKKGGHFLLLAGLPGADPARFRSKVKREVTLVLDRSGSMGGRKIEQAKEALLQVLQTLEAGEAFNIVVYNGAVETFAPVPVLKDEKTESAARSYIASVEAGGGTNLHGAVLHALRPPPREGFLPLVLLLSDGLPTAGVTSESAIRRDVEAANVHHRRLFTFGVGHDVNVPLLDRLAQVSRGSMTQVQQSENVEEKVSVLFQKLEGPVFTSPVLVNLDPAGSVTTRAVSGLLPATLPDLFNGDQFVLLGRYLEEEPLHFRLKGSYLGEPKTFDFRFDLSKASVRNAFVPRLWASRQIAVFIDALRQAGADEHAVHVDPKTKELVDEIVRLSVKYGILTEYTAFLALEGTDLSDAELLNKDANGNIQKWAVQNRSGAHAASQEANFSGQRKQSALNGRNGYYDRNMNRVEITTVQQVADLSFFRRGNRWVDSRVVSRKKDVEPDEVVLFGSDRFEEILTKLVSLNRAGVLSLGGEAVFELDGKVIRVKFEVEDKR